MNEVHHHHIENDPGFKGLRVNAGINQPPSVNPKASRIFQNRKKKLLQVSDYVSGIIEGNRVILSQAVTLIESLRPDHQEVAQQIIEQCLPYSGHSVRIGITGVPGAGKSTFIEALGQYITSKGGKLAVLAIDPSSERTRGSILGDKTRMEELATNPKAYIRPSPSAGSLGGVARKTRETIVLCEAAGFDTLIVETVGVGQSETAVHSMVDFFLLLQIAGAGDELQGIKRGIMEMTDGIVVNKADGNNIEKAQLAMNQIKNALHLFPMPPSGWSPKVLTCSSKYKEQIDQVWDMIGEYLSFVKQNQYFGERRSQQATYWMYETINESLKGSFFRNPELKTKLKEMEQLVLENRISSFIAAKSLLELYFRTSNIIIE